MVSRAQTNLGSNPFARLQPLIGMNAFKNHELEKHTCLFSRGQLRWTHSTIIVSQSTTFHMTTFPSEEVKLVRESKEMFERGPCGTGSVRRSPTGGPLEVRWRSYLKRTLNRQQHILQPPSACLATQKCSCKRDIVL